jgi:muramoyltetrapeptide carboxypeptidase LdcA involved in peptidoglycan recycling
MAIIPPALKKGDTIAILSPSSRLNDIFPLRVARGKAWLEGQGFVVKTIFTPSLPDTPLSTNAKARAEEFHSAFKDSSVRAVICTIGGSTCNQLLPFLDHEIVKKNPKIFMGSSDISLLHHFLYAKCGLRSFYGPSIIPSLGAWPRPLDFTVKDFEKVLMRSEVLGTVPRSEEFADEFLDWEAEGERIEKGTMRALVLKKCRGWKWLREGKAEGRVWGGCLPSILQVMGTEWDVSYKDKIMLIGMYLLLLPSSPL